MSKSVFDGVEREAVVLSEAGCSCSEAVAMAFGGGLPARVMSGAAWQVDSQAAWACRETPVAWLRRPSW